MFRATHIRRYTALMQARGFDIDAVLAGSAISQKDLENSFCLIDPGQSRAVVKNMINLTGDSGLGLALGAAARITDLGIVGHAFMSGKTMRQVVGLWIQYGNSLVGSLLRLNLEEESNGDWTIRVIDSGIRGQIFAFCVEEFFVFGTRIGGVLTGEPFKLRRVQLSYSAPSHHARYTELFECPIEFGAAESRLTIASPILDQSLSANHDAFDEVCVRHCHDVMRQISSKSPLISRLRSMFLQRSNSLPSMAEAARELGLSIRTLRRKLLDENTSYQGLLDQVRHDLAIEYLNTGHMTSKEVAYLLGFQFPSAFRRAFRAWTGQTVGEYLVRQRLSASPDVIDPDEVLSEDFERV